MTVKHKKLIRMVVTVSILSLLSGISGCFNNVPKIDDPPVCGGVTETIDSNAPHEISSSDISHFEVETSFSSAINQPGYEYIYVYAEKTEGGILSGVSFLTSESYWSGNNTRTTDTEFITCTDIMHDLDLAVKKYDFASDNGYSHYVAGLPENFGGSVNIKYSSGERISFSDNQTPVISDEAAEEIIKIILNAISKQRECVPTKYSAEDIVAVECKESRSEKDSYEIYRLEGTRLTSESRFGTDSDIYKHDNNVDPEIMEKVRNYAEVSKMLYWNVSKSDWSYETVITFEMKDGSKIEVSSLMNVPQYCSRIISDIQLMFFVAQQEAEK